MQQQRHRQELQRFVGWVGLEDGGTAGFARLHTSYRTLACCTRMVLGREEK